MADNTNGMNTFMGRGAGVDGNGVIPNIAYYPKIRAKTAAYTVLIEENGSVFTTTGATAAVAFTLPAIASGPFIYYFLSGADVAMTVVAETADTIVTFNNLTADSVGFSTASEIIGGAVMVVCDGTTLFAIPMGAGGHVQTFTVTDA
jgi:hypothetical protein